MMVKSNYGLNIKIRSLTVKEMNELTLANFEKEDPVKFINNLVIKCSSLPALQNNIVGGMIMDILKMSLIDIKEDTKEKLERLSSIANTFPRIFSDTVERPELKTEVNEIYTYLVNDIQPDPLKFLKDKFKIYSNLTIQPSELERLPYWEYKYYLREIDGQNRISNKRN